MSQIRAYDQKEGADEADRVPPHRCSNTSGIHNADGEILTKRTEPVTQLCCQR